MILKLHICVEANVEIPCRRFEIEGEVFMCAPQEADEPKNYQEAIKFSTSDE